MDRTLLAAGAAAGAVVGAIWVATGHPRTNAFTYAFEVLSLLVVVVAFARKTKRWDTLILWFGVLWVARGTTNMAAGIGLLAIGAHPTSHAVRDLWAGALAVLCFGGALLLVLWVRGPWRTLSDDQIATLPPEVVQAKSARVTIVLHDGRRRRALITEGRLLGGAGLSVSATDVAQIIPGWSDG